MALIELKDAGKSYGARAVLHGVNLEVDQGEFVSIVGTSASGKTKLIKMAAGLIHADRGTVLVEGREVDRFPDGAAIVFQNYSLLPWLSALENVRLAVESAFPDWPASRHKDQAVEYLERFGLGAALAKTLGSDSVVLIRGHGNAVVGASLPWAVLRAVYTQLNARVQMDAIALGGLVIYLDDDELKMHPVEVFDVDRPWQNLKSRLPKNP